MSTYVVSTEDGYRICASLVQAQCTLHPTQLEPGQSAVLALQTTDGGIRVLEHRYQKTP